MAVDHRRGVVSCYGREAVSQHRAARQGEPVAGRGRPRDEEEAGFAEEESLGDLGRLWREVVGLGCIVTVKLRHGCLAWLFRDIGSGWGLCLGEVWRWLEFWCRMYLHRSGGDMVGVYVLRN